jgi:hypothetical protein
MSTNANVDTCDSCHVELADGAHYCAQERRVLCAECNQGRTPPVSMPPSKAGERQIAAWLRPRTSKPAAPRTPRQHELVQRQPPAEPAR